MTLDGVKAIVNGNTYNKDGRLAFAFAQLTGRPETEVLGILREFIAWTAAHTQGRNKWGNAVDVCCDSFVKWYEDSASYGC